MAGSARLWVLLLVYRQGDRGSGTPVALVGIPQLIHDVHGLRTGFSLIFDRRGHR